jgi:hypothetical protein
MLLIERNSKYLDFKYEKLKNLFSLTPTKLIWERKLCCYILFEIHWTEGP